MSARSSATVANSELSAAHSSVSSGSFLTLTSLTSTRNAIRSSGFVRVGGVEGEDGAGLGAVQLGVELGHDRAAAHLVEVVVDADHLGARGVVAVQVDRDQVAVDGGAIDHVELGVVLAQPVDLVLDLFVLDVEARQRDLQAVVARNGDERAHLDDGIEGDGAARPRRR